MLDNNECMMAPYKHVQYPDDAYQSNRNKAANEIDN